MADKDFYDLYLDLLQMDYNGKLVWQRVKDNEYTVTPQFVGELYDKSDVRLMVVGRAMNGWETDFSKCSSAESIAKKVIEQIITPNGEVFDDVVNDKGIQCEGRNNNYFYTSSNFWKLIKHILDEYEESYPGIWYGTKQENNQWNQRIIWSNLYKISPWNGGNPDWSFFKPKMQTYINLIQKEIETYKPKRVLFVTNVNYFNPWKKEPSFAKAFNVDLLDAGREDYVVMKGAWQGTKIVVCKRPDVWGISNADINRMAKEIKVAFGD